MGSRDYLILVGACVLVGLVLWVVQKKVSKRESLGRPYVLDLLRSDSEFIKGEWLLERRIKDSRLPGFMRDLLLWPKFYLLLFVFFPVVIGIILNKLVVEEEDLQFLVPEDQNVEIDDYVLVGQLLIWISVWFFSAAAFPRFLSCLQSTVAKNQSQNLFIRLPVQYYERIGLQFLLCGGLFLISGAVELFFSDAEEINDESMNYILSAASIFPFVAASKTSYYGLYLLFDIPGYGPPAGFKIIWWLAEWTLFSVMVFFLYSANELAGYAILASWVFFSVVPTVIWGFFCKITRVAAKEEETFPVKWGTGAAEIQKVYAKVPDSAIGLKHWVVNLLGRRVFPKESFAAKIATENDTSMQLLSARVKSHPAGNNPEKATFSSAFCTCILSINYLFCYKPLNFVLDGDFSFETKAKTVVVLPPLGRSVSALVQNTDACLFLVNSPGIMPSLTYFWRQVTSIKDREATSSMKFVWTCETFSQLMMISRGVAAAMQQLLDENIPEEEWSEKVDFMVIYTGKVFWFEFISDMHRQIENDFWVYKISQRITQDPELSIGNVNLDTIINKEDQETDVAIVGMGSTDHVHNCRRIVKKSAEYSKDPFYDVIFEKSVYNDMPENIKPIFCASQGCPC